MWCIFLSTDNSAPNSTPAGNSLNLFDEILIEEGTAKEASYNEVWINVTKIICFLNLARNVYQCAHIIGKTGKPLLFKRIKACVCL